MKITTNRDTAVETLFQKLLHALVDPQIGVATWGGVGGLIAAIFRRVGSLCAGLFSVILGVLFAIWFTAPLIAYFGLPTSAAGGIGAVLGIASHEISDLLATGRFIEWFRPASPQSQQRPRWSRRRK